MKKRIPLNQKIIASIWKWLTKPAALVRDTEERRLSSLLAASLILVLPLIILVGLIIMPFVSRAPSLGQAPTFLPASIAAVVSLISFVINRLGKYQLAARLYISVFIFSPWLAVYQDSSQTNLPIAILMLGGVLIASILTPDGWSIFAAALGTIVGVLLLPAMRESVTLADVAAILSVIVTINSLIIVLTYYRDLLERERQEQLRAENLNLHESSEYNDERLAGLIDAIIAMSSLDFSKRAPIGDHGDMFDAVATGINALSEEFEVSVVSRAELEASEEHYRTFFEDFPIGVYRVTAGEAGKHVMVNAAYLKMFGYSSLEELVHQVNVSDLYMDPAQRKDFSERLLANGHVDRVELHLKRSDSTPIWGAVTASVVHDKNGEVFFDCAIEDITERKRAEAQMRLQTTALESAVNGIMIIDRGGRIIWANSSLMKMTGYSLDELIGKSPAFIRKISQEDNEYEKLWSAVKAGLPWHGEVSNMSKDGNEFIAEMTITPVTNEPGKITHFISICNDISEKIQARDKLEYLATHDTLTDLPNRLLFSDRLTHALAMAARSGGQGAILMIDLDDFKAINDAFSHDDGDEFLKLVAGRFKECLRESDTVARIGGDEFAILLENIDQDDVNIVAQKVNRALSEPVTIRGNTIISTASIGISLFPQDGDVIQALLKNADLAMYQAKEDKNTFQFYNHEMATRVEKQMELSTYLRYALNNEIFQLYYQPQVNSETGKVTGMEALLRLPHPERKWISPVEFIPLAEKTGLIASIDEWVLRTAGKKMRELLDAGFNEIKMSVNLSTRQLGQSNLFNILEDVLKENNLESRYLELEISEGGVFQNVEKAILTLTKLKTMGVRLAIDDFGTGFASLNYLAQFPIDTLKIDMSFTQKILSSKSDAAIVAGVIAIANSLGLGIIVEGVDKIEQLDFFSDLGCHFIQGYYYSPAVPGNEINKLLSTGFGQP